MNKYCALRNLLPVFLLTLASSSIAATNFGSVSLPSNTSATVTLTFTTAATLGSISVLTQGVADQDFTSAGGGTCSVGAPYAAAATCTVVVQFSPAIPGPRYGAVILRDSTVDTNIIATAYLQGNSKAPQIGLVNAPIVNLGYVPIWPYSEQDYQNYDYSSYGGLAFDPTGSIYIASQINGAMKWAPQPDGTVVVSDLDVGTNPASGPGIAIDGSGNLYIACGTAVCKETPAPGGGYTLSTILPHFIAIFGLAVDADGDLYIDDNPAFQLGVLYKETRQPDGTFLESTINPSLAGAGPVIVDPDGNVFVSDGVYSLFKETPFGNSYIQATVSSSLFNPLSLALDSNDDVIAADTAFFLNVFNNRKCVVGPFGNPAIVKETFQTDGSYLATLDTSFLSPNVIGFDSVGNRYVVDSFSDCYSSTGSLYKTKIDNPTPPTVAFGSVLHGTTTSPETVAFTNYGNATLQISAITFPADFPKAAAAPGDCAVGTPLAPGANCNISFFFQATRPLNGRVSIPFAESIKITSNSFKRSQQLIQLTGTELASTVATPVLSLAAGTYPTAQTLTITESTPGAAIYYTTNGSTPTSASIQYTAPINVNRTETVTTVGVLAGDSNSAPVFAHYLIQQPAAAPVFSIHAGTYNNTQTVTIRDTTPGVIIYYTLNGSTPTSASQKYTAPVAVRNTYTLKAIAIALPDYYASSVTSALYNLAVAAPTFSPAGGSYVGTQAVTITDATVTAQIRYTTNGTKPISNSPVYTGPITVSSSETIRAMAIATGYTASSVVTQSYTIQQAPATPTLSIPGGTYNNAQRVAISDSVPGTTIYYTINGSTPTTASTRYTGPVSISNTHTLKAIATANGYPPSAAATAVYTLVVANPVMTPSGGTYTGTKTVTITSASTAAHILYTTNGAKPVSNSPVYTGPITVSSSETIRAVAIATGYTSSALVTNTYTIQ